MPAALRPRHPGVPVSVLVEPLPGTSFFFFLGGGSGTEARDLSLGVGGEWKLQTFW